MSIRTAVIVFLALLPCAGPALGPHEVLVLANKNSARSVQIAGEFAQLRHVPDVNVVYLDIPADAVAPVPSISPEGFTRYIWTPATNAVARREIGDHILAWIYSVDFPVRISSNPVLSIQGLTFMRNHLPADTNGVIYGKYSSPLFTGPDNPGASSYPSQTFDVFASWLGADMPLPSMMLGYAGERGNTVETILKYLRAGVAADCTSPTGTVFFVNGKDVRAAARSWEFPLAVRELASKGVASAAIPEMPAGINGILGVMAGNAIVDPRTCGHFIPGSFADHLTSAAAIFDGPDQTKLSAWLDAGATASAGTVVEPFALWPKFPAARLYAHYAAGCTMIESLFLSIRCPVQILLVGDPLCCPWGPRAELTLSGLSNQVAGQVSIAAEVHSQSGCTFTRYMYLLDGRNLPGVDPASGALTLDTMQVSDGPHVLRAIAYRAGMLRSQVFVEKVFCVRNDTAGIPELTGKAAIPKQK